MQSELDQLKKETLETLSSIETLEALLECKNGVLGKKGKLTDILKGVKDLSPEDKATIGKSSNDLKKELAEAFASREREIKILQIEKQLEEEFEDMTVPSQNPTSGHIHPIKKDRRKIIDIFLRMGFDIHITPDITTEYDNFDAVNIPKWHPARDMQDTFWLDDGSVLATHASCLQNWLLKNKTIPFQALYLGPSYRNEKIDATHDVMFDQLEIMAVGEDINLTHLRHTIIECLNQYFEREMKIRMRPGYFPFVEPGLEVDIWWETEKGGRWLEFGGCGLIHPNVLREGGVDPEKYSGFAGGFGLTRLPLIKYGIDDLRYIHQNRIEFLEQF